MASPEFKKARPYPDACKTVADCDRGDEGCRVATCADERCVYDDMADGTPLIAAMQTVGDCVEAQCNGKGRQKLVLVVTDIPDDNEPCTQDECVGTTPTHHNLASTPCYTGPGATIGVGNCKGGV